MFVADRSNHVVRRIALNGTIQTVVGNAFPGFGGDGGPATQAQLNRPSSIAIAADGSLLIGDAFNHRIRQVRGGIIQTFAGSGIDADAGDGGQAVAAQLVFPQALAVAPDQALLVADSGARRVRKVTSSLPGIGATDLVIPNRGLNQVDVFDARGRHLRTVNTLTNAVVYDFGYDEAGRLSAITDFDGSVTQVERDAAGVPTAIVGPHGQRTQLSLNNNGYLATVSNPLGEYVELGYGVDGLLTSEQDARGNLYQFEYESDGRLKKDSDPAGGSKLLSRVETGNGGHVVSKTTALGHTTSYTMSFANGAIERRVTQPSGLFSTEVTAPDGSIIRTGADGTRTVITLKPDPRFGLLDPSRSVQSVTPLGLTSNATRSSTVVVSDPNDPLSLVSQTEMMTENGQGQRAEISVQAVLGRCSSGTQTRCIRSAQGPARSGRRQKTRRRRRGVLMSAFLDHFGLRSDPFSKEIDDGKLWLPDSKRGVVDDLVSCVHDRKHAAVTGEPGVGKTCVLRALRHALGSDQAFRLTYCHNVTLGRRDFYRHVCHALNIPYGASAGDVFHSLSKHIEELSRERTFPVLLVDEAHLMHQDTLDHLHILLNYAWDSKALLSLILIGLPDLNERLAMRRNRSLQSRLTYRLSIDPLSPDDTAEYIRTRLAAAGVTKELFTSDAIAMIHEAASGSLRDIDRISHTALRGSARRKRKLVERDVVQLVLQTADYAGVVP